VIFEDQHLLVVCKPAGWNTHAPSPYAGEGIYDWLRHRESRWDDLAIVHRLDKESSGVLVFGKTPRANRSLTTQFAEHRVEKCYHLLTDRPTSCTHWVVRSHIHRQGGRYAASQKRLPGSQEAETRFRVLSREAGVTRIEAQPVTGRTHQIRVHAADSAIPILGDTLYGGSTHPRVCLHAASIRLEHPLTGESCLFTMPIDFTTGKALEQRAAMLDPGETNCARLIHGASDGWPGWYVDRLGDYLLSQSEAELSRRQLDQLAGLLAHTRTQGAYHKRLTRHVRQTAPVTACPEPVLGRPAPSRFLVRENGLQFELSFEAGYSVGLFLDQRDNRRRLQKGHLQANWPLFMGGARGKTVETLNAFAYTCAFSVCAAQAGSRVTSLDLSRTYLEWGRKNFIHNRLDPAGHDFIHGDAMDWLKRLHRKGRRYQLIILDPPTFSQSKQSGVFQAERDYGALAAAALGLLDRGGTLLASSNAASWKPESFLQTLRSTVRSLARAALRERFYPQPPDFPITRDEPGYLKTVWLQIG
jgi:23S rRNA (cytosine1962-C5)-methyltransferase